jgi:rod shape-determining protein MreC
MLKRAHYIALGLVVVLTLIILNLPSKTTARLKLGIGSSFIGLFGLANTSRELAGKAGDALTPRSELLKEIETLRHDNQELRLQVNRAEELARENARLRQLVGWPQKSKGKFKLGSVVLREPANWWRTVQIDLGSRNGLTNDLPVLAPDGALVGRISSVSLTSSRVVLLGDPNCKVSARVANATGDMGVIGASGPLDSEFVEMSYLSKNADLKPGQSVWTSGVGGIFPKDILIGKIVDTRAGEYGLNTVARVKLAASLNALEEVWVMMEP